MRTLAMAVTLLVAACSSRSSETNEGSEHVVGHTDDAGRSIECPFPSSNDCPEGCYPLTAMRLNEDQRCKERDVFLGCTVSSLRKTAPDCMKDLDDGAIYFVALNSVPAHPSWVRCTDEERERLEAAGLVCGE